MRMGGNRAILWLCAIVFGGMAHVIMWPLSEPPALFSDFYKAYWVAGEHLWRGGLEAGYPFTVRGNWSNLPVLAWPFALLVPFGREAAGWIYLGAGAAATLAAWVLLVRLSGLAAGLASALLVLFLLNGPLLNTLREGNSTHFVLLYLIAGLVFWQARQDYAAGLAFGLCAAIKLPLLLLGVYFVARRRWSIVAGGATILGIAGGLSLVLFGFAAHIAWYEDTIGSNMGMAIAAFNAQSIDGFLIRLTTGMEELLYWGPIEPPLYQKIVRNLLVLVLAGGFGWLMLRAERRALVSSVSGPPTPHDLLQVSMVLLLSLLISPLTWTHYYVFALIPLGLYLGGKLPLPSDGITRSLFWIGYALTSLPVIIPAMEIDPDPPSGWLAELAARTIISAWFFGASLLLACFARAAWIASRAESISVLPATSSLGEASAP